MTDEELVKRLREGATWDDDVAAADRIEALTAERDDHWKSFVHWRKEADDRAEQLEAARADAKEAEAYAEELEKELRTTRMAQAVMDNTVADLEAKLAKAVEALQWCAMYGDGDVALATIAEIKGESHD
jgi:chromosome segregation ATPase